jgi:pilus assembly protein CpaD
MRRVQLTATLLIATSLAGCASGPSGPVTARNNPSLYSVHQPVIQRNDYVLDLDASGDSLSVSEQARLAAWLETIELQYGDRIFVDEPRDYPAAGTRAGVASLVGEYGMLLQRGSAPITGGLVAPGTVRIVVSRATASVPGCPDWGEDQIAPTVRTSSNYGCATNANLAAMIADPNDLVVGRGGNVDRSSQTANRAIRVYRDRAQTGATGTVASPGIASTQGGN